MTFGEPDIDVSPPSWDYGDVPVGSTSDKDFTVQNMGTATLHVSETTVVGPDAGQFDIISGGGAFSLAPGETRTVTVRFAPTSKGLKTATLRFTSDDPDENPKDVSLSGTGVVPVPDIDVNPTRLDFGEVLVGTCKDRVLTIANEGTADLVVSSVTSDNPAFTIVSPPFPQTIAPRASIPVTGRFCPPDVDLFRGTFTIMSNDPDENPVLVPVTGTGTEQVDTVEIKQAVFLNPFSLLFVSATSSAAPEAELSLTVPGCVTDAPMRLLGNKYLYWTRGCRDLDGQTATVTSSFGGSDTETIR